MLEQFAQTAKAPGLRMALHGVVVRRHDGAVFEHRYFLCAKQHLCRARLQRRGVFAQHMLQQNLGDVLHQDGRHVHAMAFKQGQVAGLQSRLGQQAITKAQPHGVVFGCVRVFQAGQLFCAHRLPGCFAQSRVQIDLSRAGRTDRRQLRALQQRLQKSVGHEQMASCVLGQQPIARAWPQRRSVVGHGEHQSKERRATEVAPVQACKRASLQEA